MNSLIKKLTKQQSENHITIVVTDLDGTLFSPTIRILLAPLYNHQTKQVLENFSIPFIIATGRKTWTWIDDLQIRLLGLPLPDVVIAGVGTEIWYRNNNGTLEKDLQWENQKTILSSQLVGKEFLWVKQDNALLLRAKIRKYPVQKLLSLRSTIPFAQILFTEKLLWKNDEKIFSGDVFLLPKTAGKEKALISILSKIRKDITKHVSFKAFIFGDASIDIPLLGIKHTSLETSSYLVHPTPLAKYLAKKHRQITVTQKDGPQAIKEVLTEKLVKPCSPAQNNPLRQLVRLFEPILNTIMKRTLSPNDISLTGLHMIQRSLSLINSRNPIHKLYGWYLYVFGSFTDVLDGIRARHPFVKTQVTVPGQLLDGFCDRAKEFMQLYQRHMYSAAISCCLPSIARAQAEIYGVVVKEKDEKGGSMIDRTIFLFQSLFFRSMGFKNLSKAIDTKMYEKNIATFIHRKQQIPLITAITDEKLTIDSQFQKDALERFLLYVQVLQEEYRLIMKKSTDIAKEEQLFQLIKPYLLLNISALRKKYTLRTYPLLSLENSSTIKL